MLKEYPCNLCGSMSVDVLYPSTASGEKVSAGALACTNSGHGEYFQVVRCRACGLLFSSPRPDTSELENEYALVEDDIYAVELAGRIRAFERNLDRLAHFRSSGTLLDVGCAMGVFLSCARARGWSVRGVEPSAWCVKKGQVSFKVPLQQGTYKDLAALGEKFDVVTMWDVIEHVDDPLAALRACHGVLKEDGILALSTVDAGSWYARLLGRRWPWLMKMHIYYFDRRTMAALLEKAGFEVIKMGVYKHVVSFKYLEHKLGAINKFLQGIMTLLSRVPGVPNMFLVVAMGDFMEVYARKRTEGDTGG